MAQRTISEGELRARGLLTSAAMVAGYSLTMGSGQGVGAGQLAWITVRGELFLAGALVLGALVRWAIAPGDRHLARTDRIQVDRVIRRGTAIDDARLAPAVTQRGAVTAYRLERLLAPSGLLLRYLWALTPVAAATASFVEGRYWLAGFNLLVVVLILWQHRYWDAGLVQLRERALAAAEAARRLLPDGSPTPPALPSA